MREGRDNTLAGTVLVVSDDAESLSATATALSSAGHRVLTAADLEQAGSHLESGDVDVVVADTQVRAADAFDVLRLASARVPPAPVVVLTAYGTVEDAVEAMKLGALDYVVKPLDGEDLQTCVHQALERRRMLAGEEETQEEITGFGGLLGSSQAIQGVIDQIRRVAPFKSTVLISGESGTGKELVARAIHALSAYAQGQLMAVNCSALHRDLVESELFGHEKGAFTGATTSRKGLFEAAEGGTLFLDEIGDLALETQAKLLRTMEDRQVMRLGSTTPISVNLRLLAATNTDLEAAVRDARFREDLYYRLNVLSIELPPLRERPEDIPVLFRMFLDRFAEENGLPPKAIAPRALSCLEVYGWPGNVRELKNTAERLAVETRLDVIEAADLPAPIRGPLGAQDTVPGRRVPFLGLTLSEIEAAAIRGALEHTRGNRTHAAKLLGISLRTLQRKLKEYGDIPSGFSP